MKFLNRKRRNIALSIVAMGVIGTLHFNCAPSMYQSANHGSGSFSSTSVGGCGAADCFEKPKSPYALLTSYQVFSTMLNVTDLNNQVTANMRAEYDARTGSLADTDNLTSITAPMQMAATGIAGEVCNAVLTREQPLASSARKFFQGVDFTRNLAGNTQAAYSQSLQVMAQAFWGRGLTLDEMRILTDFYAEYNSEYGATGAAAEQVRVTRKLYLSACTAMLSSFDTMIN